MTLSFLFFTFHHPFLKTSTRRRPGAQPRCGVEQHFLSEERTCTKKHFFGPLAGVAAGADPFG